MPSLVITFRMKWARRSNLRRMISLDRNPCFTERNRLSAKAYRLRLRATAESASPRARPLRHRASGLCHAARSSGQLDLPRHAAPGSARVPRGESAIGLCFLRSGVAWRWPSFNRVWPTRKLCDGLPGSSDVRRLGRSRHGNDSGLVRGLDLPELVGKGAWLDGRAARVLDGTHHEPDDDNLANGEWPVPVWCAAV